MMLDFLNLGRLNAAYAEGIQAAVQRVLASGWYLHGNEIEAFEREFAVYCEVEHCIGVANGLDAPHLILRAYGIGPGDEVNTFIATWLAVSHAGATPVPVEPDARTCNAVLRVKLAGLDADNAARRAIAQQYLAALADSGLVLPHVPACGRAGVAPVRGAQP
jgi:dTDP-4-amino-4,6-dideoxygalactose transaminase